METNEEHISVSVLNVPDSVSTADFHEWMLNEMNAVQQTFPGEREVIFIRLYIPAKLSDAVDPEAMNIMFQGIVDVCPNIRQIRLIRVEKSLTPEELRAVLSDIRSLIADDNEDPDKSAPPSTLH